MAPYLRMTISVRHGKGKASQLQTSPSSHVFCFTGYKLRKTDPESSNYLRYFTGNVFPDCNCFCPPFWKRDAADNLSRTRNVHDFWQWERYNSLALRELGSLLYLFITKSRENSLLCLEPSQHGIDRLKFPRRVLRNWNLASMDGGHVIIEWI